MRFADITLVALGGALGAGARFVLGGWLTDRWGVGFPWHTFAINVGGAFLLGLLMSLSLERGAVSPSWRLFLGTGLLGGFTTFSTLSYESLALMAEGSTMRGFANMFGSGAAGLVAAWLGFVAGRIL
jgi:CrcB protein